METAMQKAINTLRELANNNTHSNLLNTKFNGLADDFEANLLPKERKQIIEAYEDGGKDGFMFTGEQYYSQNYPNK